MSTPPRPAAAVPRWLVWPFGALVVAVCGLVAVGRTLPVFVLPEVTPPDSRDSSLGVPQMNPWDMWTGTGDPRMLREWVSVVAVIAFAGFLALCAIVVISRIRARLVVRHVGVEHTVPERTFDRVAATRAVSDVLDESVTAVAHARDVDDAIVSCWHALGEAAADHGLPRRADETSTEYAGRLARELGLGSDGARILAGLYREARFSEHDMPSAARDTASRLLADMRDELAASAGGRR